MSRQLPALNALRAFEAAARHLSFKNAADELNVTPAAISQQVKSLEEYYGVTLFRRLTRALRLTDAGQSVLPLLRDGFDKLGEAADRLSAQRDSGVLTVSVPPSFGAKWLVPRLGSFGAAHPEFDLRIDATDRLADFGADGIDIALRYGRGEYEGLEVELLMAGVNFPVCSPALLEGERPLRTPQDLRHHTLLHVQWRMESDYAPNWRMWLRAAGVEDVDPERGPRFTMEDMAVQAAIEGQGVAMVSGPLVQRDIEAGRLVRPFCISTGQTAAFSYYVVYPRAHIQNPKVQAFLEWIRAEVEASEIPRPVAI